MSALFNRLCISFRWNLWSGCAFCFKQFARSACIHGLTPPRHFHPTERLLEFLQSLTKFMNPSRKYRERTFHNARPRPWVYPWVQVRVCSWTQVLPGDPFGDSPWKDLIFWGYRSILEVSNSSYKRLIVSPPTLCQQSHLWDLQHQLKQNLRMKQGWRSDGVSAKDREKKEERERGT